MVTSVLVVDGAQSCPSQGSTDIANSMDTPGRSTQKQSHPDETPRSPKWCWLEFTLHSPNKENVVHLESLTSSSAYPTSTKAHPNHEQASTPNQNLLGCGSWTVWVSFPCWSTSRWNPEHAFFNPTHHICSHVCQQSFHGSSF